MFTYSPKTDWYWSVFHAASHVVGQPLDGSIAASILFFMPRPKSRPKDQYPDTKPDIDNLAKGTLDALGAARVFVNDSRIVSLTCKKRWASESVPPGASISLSVLGVA